MLLPKGKMKKNGEMKIKDQGEINAFHPTETVWYNYKSECFKE